MDGNIDKWADKVFRLLIAVKLVALAAFALTLTHISVTHAKNQAVVSTEKVAADIVPAIVCTGKNVLPDLKQNNPEAFAAIEKKARATLNGSSVFWKIEKPGVQPSYLLGTMHMSDARVVELSKRAEAAFVAANTLAVEIAEIADQSAMAARMMSLRQYTMLTDGSTLEQKLAPETISKLKARLKGRDVPWFLVKRMQPWVVTAMVALPACELARKKNNQIILDKRLAERAKADKKNLVGLETIEEQIKIIASLPSGFHLSALKETAELGDLIDDMIETMIVLYERGDTGSIWPLMEHISPQSSTGEGYVAFQELMVDRRNQTMLVRALPLIEQGNTFIAVGALHLPGVKGLVNLLQQAGYLVTPVEEPTSTTN